VKGADTLLFNKKIGFWLVFVDLFIIEKYFKKFYFENNWILSKTEGTDKLNWRHTFQIEKKEEEILRNFSKLTGFQQLFFFGNFFKTFIETKCEDNKNVKLKKNLACLLSSFSYKKVHPLNLISFTSLLFQFFFLLLYKLLSFF